MKEIIKQNSKLIGALLGLLQALPQGLSMESEKVFANFDLETLFIVVAFGLLTPPILALFNAALKEGFVAILMKKINEYVNLYYMMIVGCLVLGITGLFTLEYNGVRDGAVILCAFFIAGGVGFWIAYFIDGRFGRRAKKNA